MNGDTITCSACGTVLEAGTEGRPCPTCGSTARTYMMVVGPGQIVRSAASKSRIRLRSRATGHAISERAARRLDELATGARKLEVWVHSPGEDGTVLCEVLDHESRERLVAEVGSDAEDAVLNAVDVIAGTRKDDSTK
jgi:hypothetical protein